MSNLLKPLHIRQMKLINRLVLPPMATSKADEKGHMTQEILDYYDDKSKDGYIGLIIIEHSFVRADGKASDRQLSVVTDDDIDGLKSLADAIHKNGSKTIMQINHAGSAANSDITGFPVLGPSAVANPRRGTVPTELSREIINQIISDFKDAALRVKKAGFDGVEIHSAHGYLLNQFYSPLANKRSDEYGGDVLGRIKIHLDIIHAVRASVGDDFPILLRLGASDYTEGGTTLEDSLIAAKAFEEAGIDALDISGGFNGYSVPNATIQGYFSELTHAIKKIVSIPVILTGGITDIYAAEKLLETEKADLIGVGRAIYSDSNWAKSAIESLK